MIVRKKISPRNPSRLRLLEDDPDVRFYKEVTPRFAEEGSRLTWIPMDLANIAGAIFRTFFGGFGRTIGTSRQQRFRVVTPTDQPDWV
jgi:hypothetical protein